VSGLEFSTFGYLHCKSFNQSLSFTVLFQIVFEGVRGKDYQGDIAIDDIAVKAGFCPPLKECTFEDVNMCGWTNEKRYCY